MEKSINDFKFENNNQNGIKILADQMAKKMFGYEIDSNNRPSLTQEQIANLIWAQKEKENETEKPNHKLNDNEDITKLNQNQDINSYINTNVNTKENQNTIINTLANSNTIINTNSNLNQNNENEIVSNLNSRRSKGSFIDELINHYKDKQKEKEIEKENYLNFTFDDSSDSINEEIGNAKIKKYKYKKNTIYDRSIHDLKVKKMKLKKKRKENELKIKKQLKPHPELNPLTEKYLENKGYIPLEERAAKIQSLKLMKLILNEQLINPKELKDLQEIQRTTKSKEFNKYEWKKFINRQKKWHKDVQYKKKAMAIMKNNEEDEKFFKPKINSRSKSIIEEIEEEHKNYVDEVYDRLYNDYDEHLERQKYRNQQSLPSFKPKIYKCNSQKNIGYESTRMNRYKSNTFKYLNKKNYTKRTYNLNNSMDRKNELFIDSCKNFENYMKRNKNFNNKYMKFINKSQQTNQQTNNNFSKINCSQISSGLINSKYIIFDEKRKNEKSKKNSTTPFLPFNIKKMIDKNCREEEEESENINRLSEKNFEKEKYKLNYSLYSMKESKEKFKNDKYNESEIESLHTSTQRIGINDIIRNENSLNINNSELISQKEKEQERILDELEKAKKISKNKNESLDSEESNRYENNIYKINIRDTTPHLIKGDKVLASKNYSDFFDIPDLEKDI